MHLLPNGNAFFNANGQSFNPFGQSIGEANWEFLATFDPKTNTWTRLGAREHGDAAGARLPRLDVVDDAAARARAPTAPTRRRAS